MRSNIISGLTVALITIPLAISLAVVSGVSPVAGIITAIWAGGIAAIFGGSNFNIIAPTGALAGIIAAFALSEGVAAVPLLAVITGLFILIAYVLKLERYLIFIPSSVIHGFILGIASIIVLNQINFALGLSNLPAHANLVDRFIESCKHLHEISWAAFGLFTLFFLALFLVRRFVRAIPGVISVSPIGIVIGYLIHAGYIPVALESLGSKFGTITPALVLFPAFMVSKQTLITGAVIALIAIIETMLAAKIADTITKTKHNARKEIMGIGLANIASGLAGGFPVTAALALTTSNIRAGATSRLSALLSSVFIAVGSLLFLTYFSYMPMAIIAAILVYVAINMVEREHIRRIYARDKINFMIVLLVAAVTVYEDPIIGILIGSVIALLVLIHRVTFNGAQDLFYASPAITKETKRCTGDENILVCTFKSKITYLNSQAHLARFDADFSEYRAVILVLEDLSFIDSDGVDVLQEIIELVQTRRQRVLLVSPNEQIADLLHTSPVYVACKQSQLIFTTLAHALKGCENS